MTKAKAPGLITITYDLFELPTAQHRAGLAGLLLQIDSMKNRGKLAPTYKWDDGEPSTKVHVEFTEKATSGLFDDLYDATWIQGRPRRKPFFKGKGSSKREVPAVRRAPITETDKKGNEKVFEGYVYLELTPALATLRQYLPRDGDWVRLWRDLIWQVVRDSRKKAPYIQRAKAKSPPDALAVDVDADGDSAGDEDDEKAKGDGSTWADLVGHDKARRKEEFAVGKLSSALLIGAQAESAEALPFLGRIDQNLLLHFWPLTSLVYVPRFVDRDGNSHIGRRDKDDKTKHYCLAIPVVADLRAFLEEYPKVLAGLSPEVAVYRPKESLIDLPAEGGLSFVEHLARLTPQVAGLAETRRSVFGIDYLHLNKDGNIVRSLSTGRVAYSRELAEDYLAINGRVGERPPYANPLFRRGLMLALLDDQPWFKPFGKLFAEWDVSFFVPTDDPPKVSWFWADARKKTQEVTQSMPTDPNPGESPPDPDDQLMVLIHRITRTYLAERAKQKSGIDPEGFKDGDKINWDKVPQDFYDARRAAGESLFLEFRSRRDQAFVDHFAQTFFSAKQFVSQDQYSEIGRALLRRPEDVKTLTLMALSANS
jgi:CRISPR-associated protein Cmx8